MRLNLLQKMAELVSRKIRVNGRTCLNQDLLGMQKLNVQQVPLLTTI